MKKVTKPVKLLSEAQLRQLIQEMGGEEGASGALAGGKAALARQALQVAANALDKVASMLGNSPNGAKVQHLANAAHEVLQALG